MGRLRIGVGVLIALVVITYAGFHKRVPFTSQWTLRGQFTTASQLRSGSPVRIAGVDVGRVLSTSRGPGTTAIVTMQIDDRGKPIHADARLVVRPRLFLEGGFYVAIEPGSPSAPTVPSGHLVPVGQTQVPVQFFTALSTFDLPVRQAFIDTIHTLRTALGGGGASGLRQAVVELGPTLRNGAIAAQAAQGTQPGDVTRLIEGAHRVSAALAGQDAALGDSITSLHRVAGALAAHQADLAATVSGLDDTLTAAPPALTALDGSLAPLERAAAQLRPALRLAPGTLRRAYGTLVQVDAASRPAELPALIAVLHPLATALTPLEARLEVTLTRLRPVLGCLGDQALTLLNTKLADGTHSTGLPLWLELAHEFVNGASLTQSFDANGPWARYLVGLGTQLISTGAVPGLGTLTGLAPAPIDGSSPQWLGPGGGPAFHPEVSCTTQSLPDLSPRIGPPTASRTVHPAPPGAAAAILRRLARHGLRRTR